MACGTSASTRNRVTTCVKCCAAAPQRKRSSLRSSRCGKGAATAERKTAKPWAHAARWSPSSNSAKIPTSKCTPAEDSAGIPSVPSLREAAVNWPTFVITPDTERASDGCPLTAESTNLGACEEEGTERTPYQFLGCYLLQGSELPFSPRREVNCKRWG